jgi:hypothetical protein
MVLMPAVVAAIAVEGAGAPSPNGGLTEWRLHQVLAKVALHLPV